MPVGSCFLHLLYSKLFICFHILIFILILNNDLSAIEIKRIEIIGSSIELDTAQYFKDIKGDLSEKDIEALGIKVTNEYHDKGYTTSYVEKLAVNTGGVLEIYVKESKILGLNLTGLTGKEKDEIEHAFNLLIGNIYNRLSIEKQSEAIKYKYDLGSVKIYPVNYEDTGDVYLSIKLSKKARGNFYGGIGYEPIYGISPELGYYYPFADTAMDIYLKAGFRQSMFRMAEGDIKYFFFPGAGAGGIYIGTNGSIFTEHWESKNYDYKRFSLSPVIGYRSVYQYIFLDIYINETISNIENYKNNKEKFRDYDSRLILDIGLSNRADLLSKKDATDIKFSVSTGKNNLNEKIYLISSAELESAASPFTWVRIIPGIYSYYTTSDKRYFWQYVYDKRLLGIFDDFTASKWKNTAGLDIEFEIIPQFVYLGPFVNTGYFLDEALEWNIKTGGGVKSTIEVKNAYLEIYYAWDLSKEPSKGGLAILAGGKF